ncbi:hypothetical protein H7J86_32710 [Mycobacterium hackensackense]|uniref:hypothetical protein n=1 Tax=Mycobacterium hackensackense TaxID=228909 RepID=UPI0022657F3C|nr:hypothetical protein [Mycobacterium hackensackense]MCV7256947.1 hypothetical protein [Mycobacterium hackensackense]
MDVTDGDSGDAVFRMKPAAAIEVLARQFVDGQRLLAHARQVLATLPADAPVDVVTEVRQRVDDLVALWDSQQGPNLAACFRLALEVLDTYGPEGADVEDLTDAAIWNNKYFVWFREFGGAVDGGENGGSAG